MYPALQRHFGVTTAIVLIFYFYILCCGGGGCEIFERSPATSCVFIAARMVGEDCSGVCFGEESLCYPSMLSTLRVLSVDSLTVLRALRVTHKKKKVQQTAHLH